LVVTLIVVLQLWLLTATMNAYLGGDTSIVVPAALASLACFGLNLGLLRYLLRLGWGRLSEPSQACCASATDVRASRGHTRRRSAAAVVRPRRHPTTQASQPPPP